MHVRHVRNDELVVRDIRGNYDNYIKPIIDKNDFKCAAFLIMKIITLIQMITSKNPILYFLKEIMTHTFITKIMFSLFYS